jgi:hypothetical protein
MLIGLTGKMGSGKSTVADYLTENHGFVEYALAQPLKEIAMVFGFTREEVYKDKHTPSPTLHICARQFLQTFGTEIVRDQFKVFFPGTPLAETSQWVRLMKEFVVYRSSISDDSCSICISDIRFQDEVCALQELGEQLNKPVVIIHIGRSSAATPGQEHKSETGDISCDYSIENNGTLDELFASVKKIII